MRVSHRVRIAILLAFPVAGCGQATDQMAQAANTETDPGREMDIQVREAVVSKLKDPDSAQFRNVRKRPMFGEGENAYGPNVYCGEVNSRNAFGGYVGFAQFGVMPISEDGQTSTGSDPVSIGDPNDPYNPGTSLTYMSFCQDENGNALPGEAVEF